MKNDWWSEFDKRTGQGMIGLVVFLVVSWYFCKYVSCMDVVNWVIG